ncbi:MAG TPA: FkbM family methyltransferase [Prosthecobacter sp.]
MKQRLRQLLEKLAPRPFWENARFEWKMFRLRLRWRSQRAQNALVNLGAGGAGKDGFYQASTRMMSNILRTLVQRWPFSRGRTRLVLLLQPWLLRRDETVAPVGRLLFPFQPYHWNFYFGVYEPETVELVEALLGTGDTFLDVGSNVGYFSAIAANAVGGEGRVVALEPEPAHFSRLSRLAALNPEFKMDLLQAAMSDQCGRMSFYVCEHPGWHSLICSFPQAPIKESLEVDVWSMDELLKCRGLDRPGAVSLAKIDVEGAEHLVFQGGRQAVSQHWIRAFYVEVTPSRDSGLIFAMLHEAGYRPFRRASADRCWRPCPVDVELPAQENVLWLPADAGLDSLSKAGLLTSSDPNPL